MDYSIATKRANWGDGPWQKEPDEAHWTDEQTAYACAAVRHRMGHWFGYVRLPQGHPLHGVHYGAPIPARLQSAVEAVMKKPVGKRSPLALFASALGGVQHVDALFDVHGSVNYSGDRDCKGFWYGFSCDCHNDSVPGVAAELRALGLPELHGEYRTLDYVKAECASLAKQLEALEGAA